VLLVYTWREARRLLCDSVLATALTLLCQPFPGLQRQGDRCAARSGNVTPQL